MLEKSKGNGRAAAQDITWFDGEIGRSMRTVFRPEDMTTVTKEVSPALAKHMLEFNQGNRPVHKRRLEKVLATIDDGNWQALPDGIAFDIRGVLLNGQHRLMGIAQSGKTLPLRITFGADPAAFKYIDTGDTRTGGDTLAIRGYRRSNAVSAAARIYLIARWERRAAGSRRHSP